MSKSILLVKIKDDVTDQQFEDTAVTLTSLGMDIYMRLPKTAKLLVGKIEDSKRDQIDGMEFIQFTFTEKEFADSISSLSPDHVG